MSLKEDFLPKEPEEPLRCKKDATLYQVVCSRALEKVIFCSIVDWVIVE